MASQLSWLDHDAAATQRSLQILSIFNEPDARDELGIGGIRDAIADQLFPGTSTIQTRLRYVFFIPWLMERLEARNTRSSAFKAATRDAELELLEALVANTRQDEPGVIGREKREALKRFPSSVYWAALGSWGLRRVSGSQQQYYAQADRRHTQRNTRRTRDDHETHDGDNSGLAWDRQLIKLRPEGFPAGADLRLTRGEAELLLDRWTLRHGRSLLTWIAKNLAAGSAAPVDVDQIWAHPQKDAFPDEIRLLVDDAQRLNVLIRGAALLYNLELARLSPSSATIASDRAKDLAEWAKRDLSICSGWDLGEFWKRVLDQGHTITLATQTFLATWLALALRDRDDIGASMDCRQLIRDREISLKRKGNRSRFENRAARDQWSGNAGLMPLSYRWPVASDFLREWYAGWSNAQ
ncbi:DUF6361 family protein [Burkholderia plantarii]|uniref:DUF6361 family protein n=1 Tax=Burkholderia plantarii TaxID=41899 RepID=UPI0006D8A028|nr:DUF6361 family protein [Burkholderia plantarii]ALK34981.1 hypothetical protein bpln_2g27900 [Burkholderia plantarii]GLZ19062.1 hypothetical protein Bpla01_25920 [Burkholderia plantarii]